MVFFCIFVARALMIILATSQTDALLCLASRTKKYETSISSKVTYVLILEQQSRCCIGTDIENYWITKTPGWSPQLAGDLWVNSGWKSWATSTVVPFNSHMDVWMDNCLLIFHPAEESEWHQPSVTNYCHLCLRIQPHPQPQPAVRQSNIDWVTSHVQYSISSPRHVLQNAAPSLCQSTPPTAERPFWRT